MIAAVLSAASQGWMAEAMPRATGGLVAAVWQGVLLSLLVGLGLRLLPKTPATVRFAIWFGVFVVIAALPWVGLLHHDAGGVVNGHRAWLILDERWCGIVAAVWVGVSGVRAVTLGLAALRVRTLWKRATPLELERVSMHGGAVDGSVGLHEPVGSRYAELCVSDEVDRPTVIGFFAPKILIPAWLVEKLTAEELEQIVLHEAGHLSRADDWMNLLQKVALVVFPLNPALAWVERRLCFERELACDERVLETTGAPKAYAACLATLAEHRLGRRGLALALGAVGRESELGRRVRRILSGRERMRPAQARFVLGGAMVVLLVAVAGLERCPQVVGFGPSAEVATVGSVPVRLDDAARETYGYQAVVFHPQRVALSGVRRTADVVRGKKVFVLPAKPKVVLGAGNGETLQARVARPDDVLRVPEEAEEVGQRQQVSALGGAKSEDVSAAQVRSVVQWVVVTAWRGDDGSRMVLTTVRTARPGDVMPVRLGAASVVPQDQVYPYAAVPVQDGWLIFQM